MTLIPAASYHFCYRWVWLRSIFVDPNSLHCRILLGFVLLDLLLAKPVAGIGQFEKESWMNSWYWSFAAISWHNIIYIFFLNKA